MDPVIPILEPEAAAYHTLQDNSAKNAGLKVTISLASKTSVFEAVLISLGGRCDYHM